MKIFTAAASLVATAFIATAAIAQPISTNTSIRVSYADLNLSSSAGSETLARRINNAANSACDVDSNQRSLALRANSARCHDVAVSGARIAIAAAKAPVLASR